MINAGQYNKRISIFKEESKEDSAGFITKTKSVVLNAWAKVKTTKGYTLIINNTDFEKAYTNFTIRFPKTEITRDMLIEFDIKFLFYSGSVITDTPRKYYDTLAQSQKMLSKMKYKRNREYDMWEQDYDKDWDVIDYKLGTIAEYFDITFPCQHRASGDAIVTGKVFLKLIEKKQKEN